MTELGGGHVYIDSHSAAAVSMQQTFGAFGLLLCDRCIWEHMASGCHSWYGVWEYGASVVEIKQSMGSMQLMYHQYFKSFAALRWESGAICDCLK